MLNPCFRCEHGTQCERGYLCDARGKVFVEEGTLSDGKCPDFDPIYKPLDGNCDLYGKACMTCSGCPAEPPTEEEESGVWG